MHEKKTGRKHTLMILLAVWGSVTLICLSYLDCLNCSPEQLVKEEENQKTYRKQISHSLTSTPNTPTPHLTLPSRTMSPLHYEQKFESWCGLLWPPTPWP